MADYDLVITNGVCVTATDVAAYDIGIKDEKIVLLAASGSLKEATTKKLIDADGGYVMVCSSATTQKPAVTKTRNSPEASIATYICKSRLCSARGLRRTAMRQAHVLPSQVATRP